MAGVYLGFGIVLIFVLSIPFFKVQSPATSLIMGATLGVAISVVVFASAELFTSNTMIMPVNY